MQDAVSHAALVMSPREREITRELARIGGPVIFISNPRFVEVVEDSGWNDELAHPTATEAAALESLGIVAPLDLERGWGVRINSLGLSVSAELSRQDAPVSSDPVDGSLLQWARMRELCRAIYDRWLSEGADPYQGVAVSDTPIGALSPNSRRAVLHALRDEGLVGHPGGPAALGGPPVVNTDRVFPTGKAKALFGDWPSSPVEAHKHLLAALDDAIADQDTPPEEKNKLQAVRDQVTELAVGTAWTLFTTWAGVSS